MNKKLRTYFRVLGIYFRVIPGTAAVTLVNYIIQGLFPAFTALILSRLFDTAGGIADGDNDAPELLIFGLIYLAAYILNSFCSFLAGVVMETGADKNQVNYRYEICRKFAKLPLIDFENSGLKDKHRRAEQCLYQGTMNQVTQSGFRVVIVGIVGIITVSAVLARYSLLFLPLCVLSVLPYCAARLIRGEQFYQTVSAQAKKTRKMQYLWGLFTDRRTNKELRTFGADDYVLEQWRIARDETQAEIWEQSRKDAVSFALCDVFRIAGYGACIALALWLTLNGTVSVGVFGACIAAFMSLQSQTMSILVNGGSLPSHLAFAADYFEFIDLPDEKPGGNEYKGLHNQIELKNISFKYPNVEEYALKNVSFTINKGEKIAILGENGSGKTTLTKLLLGLLSAAEGAVLYDGENVNSLDKTSFHKTVSAVPQNFVRYNLPLRENVAISDVNSLNDDAGIRNSLRNAGIAELPDSAGLDAELGNAYGGSDISGGQWQKIAIARGLFRSSRLIVLDEPTSALDPLIETEILSKFIELSQDKTAVIISHRVGLCKLVDRIAVMKNGTLAEIGSHEELMSKHGEYAKLYSAQEKWYL
ncbi:MAG: ABC transporter ATP-binding protein/permease [Oscillospiraceae bacterium]|jgi:ABC-type multidrug transport system fused ATPase/permease subunit|nr:ABC transporter ATP-binding protein/permease [Oscillospiraceae bacterium]